MEEIKTLIVVFFSAIAAFLAPIQGVIYSVILAGLLNFALGLYVAKRVLSEDFSFEKAWACIKEAAIFFVVIACALFIGKNMDELDGALHTILTVTFALLYFYAVNIFKNLKRWHPTSQWIAFVHFIISIEFVKKVPFMESFKKGKETQDGKH